MMMAAMGKVPVLAAHGMDYIECRKVTKAPGRFSLSVSV